MTRTCHAFRPNYIVSALSVVHCRACWHASALSVVPCSALASDEPHETAIFVRCYMKQHDSDTTHKGDRCRQTVRRTTDKADSYAQPQYAAAKSIHNMKAAESDEVRWIQPPCLALVVTAFQSVSSVGQRDFLRLLTGRFLAILALVDLRGFSVRVLVV